jgi:phosphatidate cytidylyltransferase
MLLHRLLTAAVGIPAALVVVYFGGWQLGIFVAMLAVLGLRELYRLAAVSRPDDPAGSARVPGWICWSGYALAPTAVSAALVWPELPVASLLAALGVLGAALLSLIWRSAARGPLPGSAGASVAIVGSLLLPGLLVYLIHLRWLGHDDHIAVAGMTIPQGAGWLGLVVAVCWTADTCAYAVGKTIGAHKLWPSVSPGKTVEGAVGGLVGAMLLTVGLGGGLGLAITEAATLGLLLGVSGQLGDLAESRLKRWAGVKDSGAILPGHGGVLDRFDSLLVNAPLAYYYLRFIAGIA